MLRGRKAIISVAEGERSLRSISLPVLLSQGTWLRPQRSAIGTQENCLPLA